MKKNNSRIKKLKTIIILYRIACIVLMLMLLFSFIFKPKSKPTVVKKEIMNPNIVMLGDSITNYYDLDKYYGNDKLMVNSGINGNKANDILNDMKNRVYVYNPSKVFLLIGINNFLHEDITPEEMVNQIDKIVTEINDKLPNTKIYIESIYPINDTWRTKCNPNVNATEEVNSKVGKTNILLYDYCEENGYKYIDVYSSLVDDNYSLNSDYSEDGLHLNDNGYQVVTKILKKYM